MNPEDAARMLLSAEEFAIAKEAVRLLEEFAGPRDADLQERIERVGWLHNVDLETLNGRSPGLDDEDFWHLVLDANAVRRPEWQSIEGHVIQLAEAPGWQVVLAAAIHFGRLKRARELDLKKRRRILAGEAKYGMMPLVRLLGSPHGPWLLQQYEQELSLTPAWVRRRPRKPS